MGDRRDRHFDRHHNGDRRNSGGHQDRRGYSDRPQSGGHHKRKRDDYAEPRNEEGKLLASLLRLGDSQPVCSHGI